MYFWKIYCDIVENICQEWDQMKINLILISNLQSKQFLQCPVFFEVWSKSIFKIFESRIKMKTCLQLSNLYDEIIGHLLVEKIFKSNFHSPRTNISNILTLNHNERKYKMNSFVHAKIFNILHSQYTYKWY